MNQGEIGYVPRYSARAPSLLILILTSKLIFPLPLLLTSYPILAFQLILF